MSTLTDISKEPKIARHAIDLVSRINPKVHFPGTITQMERQLRMCLGLPFPKKLTGQTAYGYSYNAERDMYEPLPEVFSLLWQARRYLYASPIRETTDWLNYKVKKLGYESTISHMGLRNLMIMRPPYEECLLPVEEKEKIIESLTSWISPKTI